MKQLLEKAKDKWSVKVEEMIANTDSWFINEDGDIVLIYPEANDQVNSPQHNDNNDKNEETDDNHNMRENKEQIDRMTMINDDDEDIDIDIDIDHNDNPDVNDNQVLDDKDVQHKYK